MNKPLINISDKNDMIGYCEDYNTTLFIKEKVKEDGIIIMIDEFLNGDKFFDSYQEVLKEFKNNIKIINKPRYTRYYYNNRKVVYYNDNRKLHIKTTINDITKKKTF